MKDYLGKNMAAVIRQPYIYIKRNCKTVKRYTVSFVRHIYGVIKKKRYDNSIRNITNVYSLRHSERSLYSKLKDFYRFLRRNSRFTKRNGNFRESYNNISYEENNTVFNTNTIINPYIRRLRSKGSAGKV